jgi:hypothetical protein
VAAQIAAALDETAIATGVTAPVVIAKSLGSLAAPLVADRGLAAVWFSPLLTDQPTAVALRRAAAPCLLVGGTADRFGMGRLPGRSRPMWSRSAQPITRCSCQVSYRRRQPCWDG